MVEKMLLALQSRPVNEITPNQPADCLTPPNAFCSSGCALAGNTWRTSDWTWAAVAGSRVARPMIASAPSIIGNMAMKPAKARASA